MNHPPPTRVGRRSRLLLGLALIVLAGFVLLGTSAALDQVAATLSSPQASPAVGQVSSPPLGLQPLSAPTPAGSPASSGALASSTPSSSASPPASASSPSPTPSPTPVLDPPPAPGPFAMDLYREGAFVHESQKFMCVPAAMQTMVNIMAPTPDRTVAMQQRLYSLARKLSPKTLQGDGAEPEGWAAGLARLGYGDYKVTVLKTWAAAIHAAAKAVRMTGRPAGLLVWYGAHSWVMSGFKATADPALTDSFTVTHVYIEDVWYPTISTLWGRSRPPDSLVPVARLPRDFLPWRMPGGPYPDKVWKFVTVLPVAPPAGG